MSKICFAQPFTSSRYAELYDLRRKASSQSTVAINWIKSNAAALVAPSSPEISVLSIGCGDAELDIPLISSILSSLETNSVLRYVAIEPNSIFRERAVTNISQFFTMKPSKKQFELKGERLIVQIHDAVIDSFVLHPSEFDIVLVAHVLYYMEKPLHTIQRALNSLKTSGSLLIVHQTSIGVPEIQIKLMPLVKGSFEKSLHSDNISKLLQESRIPYISHRLDARLSFTGDESMDQDIMSFCLECDVSTLNPDDPQASTVVETFKKYCETSDCNKKLFLRESIEIFEVGALTKIHRLPFDKIFVSDYRILASKVPWNKLLGRDHRTRLLDVGCGSGKWMSSVQLYKFNHRSHNGAGTISVDVVEPYTDAIDVYKHVLHEPFSLQSVFNSSLQNADLPTSFYDIIWAIHSFYAIPKKDLYHAILKLSTSLSSHGLAFIVIPTRDSFYVSLPSAYMKDMVEKAEGKIADISDLEFSNFEAIQSVIDCIGIPYRNRTFFYEEAIDADDEHILCEYVVKESMASAFSASDLSTLSKNFLSGNLTWADLEHLKNVRALLQKCLRGSKYYFPQEVHLLSFGNMTSVESLPNEFGPMSESNKNG